jgi:hypothetical protein
VAATSALGTTLKVGTLGLLVRLGLAGELDRDLALKDLLARELGDGAVGLAGSREVDKGVTDRAVGARVLRDRNRLTVKWGGRWSATTVREKMMIPGRERGVSSPHATGRGRGEWQSMADA